MYLFVHQVSEQKRRVYKLGHAPIVFSDLEHSSPNMASNNAFRLLLFLFLMLNLLVQPRILSVSVCKSEYVLLLLSIELSTDNAKIQINSERQTSFS